MTVLLTEIPFETNKVLFIETDLLKLGKEYISNIIHTKRGSLAGLPLADLLYGLAMARI